jgi:hypothetical protein
MKPNSLEWSEWITDQLLYHSVQSIDARLGNGYHTKNPRLVAEMVNITYQEYLRQELLEVSKKNKCNTLVKKCQNYQNFNFIKTTSKNQKPKFKFCNFGIPIGATLQYINDPNIICIVASPNNDIFYNGKKTSMSAVVNQFLGGSNRGTSFWTYNGKLLVDMYNEKY